MIEKFKYTHKQLEQIQITLKIKIKFQQNGHVEVKN